AAQQPLFPGGGPPAAPPAAAPVVQSVLLPEAAPPPAPKPGDKRDEEPLPLPRPILPFGPTPTRLPRLDCPAPPRTTPHPGPATPGPATRVEYAKYVRDLKDPESTLDLILGRTRLLLLNQTPLRIQVADPNMAAGVMMSPLELSLVGKGVGSTILTLWFADPKDNTEHVLTYLVRVLPDPEAKERLERVYKGLQDEINHAFPDSL